MLLTLSLHRAYIEIGIEMSNSMPAKIRMTLSTMKTIDVFLSNTMTGLSGADVARKTGLMSGTLYPILRRLEKQGWLTSAWETLDPTEAGRPRQRFYKLKGDARKMAIDALSHRGFYETQSGAGPIPVGPPILRGGGNVIMD